MCGIAGLVSFKGRLNEGDCLQFVDSLAHRGPDGRGMYFGLDRRLFLGHRRLKILDLSDNGKQPMSSPDGRFVIVFNGEIYNFLELKKELAEKGYSFRSDSDTEVILAAYQEWNEACQFKFNGMWAFALWDNVEKTLFLSRDRFGVKPFYIYSNDDYFAFASEIKAFASLPCVNLQFDLQAVANTIEDPLALEPTQNTIFQGICKIPAGCSLVWKSDQQLKIRRWWDTLEHLPLLSAGPENYIEAFKDLFIDACSIRMRSDVPIGTALSGGLDSSSILCSLFQIHQTQHCRWPASWQKSFTAVFPNSSHDELEFAKVASSSTGAESFFYTISPNDLLQHIEDALYSIEDIFDPPIGPWLLYREYRKQGVTISIDGHGADELLCGYHHQFERAYWESLIPYPRLGRLKALWPLMKQMYALSADQKTLSIVLNLLKSGCQSHFDKNGVIYHILKKLYWRQSLKKSGFGRYGWLRIQPSYKDSDLETLQQSCKFQNLSPLNQMLYLDFHCKTLPSILRNFDRCSMAHGVEIRAPFMDWRLVTLAFAIPSHAKAGELGSKQILRSAMKGILPEEIRLRKSKIGFAAPLNQWIRDHLKEYILDIVKSRDFQESEIWHGGLIAQDAEKFFTDQDHLGLRRIWEFVLADRLMTRFKNLSYV